MKKNYIYIAIGVIVLGILIVPAIFRNQKPPKKEVVAEQVTRALPKEVEVELTATGFSPKEVTINIGSAVRFINKSDSDKASVNSDDYPTNKKYPELNLGAFQKASTLVHIFDKAGTYTYHDQYNPDFKGTVIVK